MPSLHKNRVQMTVSGTPGTGTITLNAASSGYQSFASAYAGNATVDILITDGAAWEVAQNCTYTNSGTTVTRGTLEASSTGSAISLSSSAVVSVIASADLGNRTESALQSVMPGGRLTLTSGTPVTRTDVSGATAVYYTPYLHNVISLWDGADWKPVVFAETTNALGTITSGKNYDVFGYLNAGSLALEQLVWTNDSTRGTAVTMQDGRYCKSGDKTRLYLGTFRTTSTTTTEDSAGGTSTRVGGKRFLWNAYNRVMRHLYLIEGTDTWTYNSATWRLADGVSLPNNCVEFVTGLQSDAVQALVNVYVYTTDGVDAGSVGIGFDQITAADGTNASFYAGAFANSGLAAGLAGNYCGIPAAGYHYLAWLEACGTGVITFIGDNGGTNDQSGMFAQVFA